MQKKQISTQQDTQSSETSSKIKQKGNIKAELTTMYQEHLSNVSQQKVMSNGNKVEEGPGQGEKGMEKSQHQHLNQHQHQHHNCNHKHHNLSKEQMILMKMKGETDAHHQHCNHNHNHQHQHQHNHQHNHNHQHKHSQNCKFHHQNQAFVHHLTQPKPIQIDLTIDASIPSAILDYLNGDLHRTWAILNKLQKANLIDKKLQGVFILKQLGLNKGTAPLKCLTTNNGDISKTLKDLKPKQQLQNIAYIHNLPQQCTLLIDGLSLSVTSKQIKQMCLSNVIDRRQMGIIKLYMMIQIISGMFLIPKQHINPSVLVKISTIVNSLSSKSQHPFKLKLVPIDGDLDKNIIEILSKIQPENLEKVVIISNNKVLKDKCGLDYKNVKFMKGEVFLEEAIKNQSKEYLEEILSLK